MSLALRLTLIGGETAPNDYTVIDLASPSGFAKAGAGQPIGRIRRAAERNGEVWIWNVTVNMTGAPNGTADSLEAAKADFRAAWAAFKAKPQ
jgi:hypothetical protein